MELKYGPMALNMKASGRTIRLMVTVHSGMFMETNMKAIGREIRLMAKESTPIPTVPRMTVCGETICNMDTVSSTGMTPVSTKENITRVRSMEKALIHGKMAPNIPVSGTRIGFMEEADILGMMAGVMRVNGRIITWMVLVFTLGKTAVDTKVNTKKTKSMVVAFTRGLTVGNMTDSGQTAASMDKESTYLQMANQEKVCGTRAVEKGGLTIIR